MIHSLLDAPAPVESEAIAGEPLRLNIGGALGEQLPGFTVVDRKSGGEAYPLNYPDNSADEIRASHVLEHFSHRKTHEVLADWLRVLKPGGRLRLAVPDWDWCIAQQQQGGNGYPIEQFIMGGHADTDDHHGTLFTERKLRALMRIAGLRRVRRWKSNIKDCASLPVSLNLEGYKPEKIDVQGVGAVMSVPRYGATASFASIITAINALRIDLRMGFGAYWQQALTMAIEGQIDAGCEYVLTIDFDSLFSSEDIRELYRLIATHPEVDAVCALQMRRGVPGALLTMKGEDGKNLTEVPADVFDQDLVPVSTAHFGLTLFRAGALKKMALPWFMPVADKDGRWGNDRIDADVNFWNGWTAAGNTLYQAPMVPIGHIEEVSIWPDRELQPLIQEISEWRKQGPPPESWR